jgi:hypothetical protein
MGEIAIKSGIRGTMAAGLLAVLTALAVLAGITGCGGAGPNAAVAADATTAVNGPYGAGGPFATAAAGGAAAAASTATAASTAAATPAATGTAGLASTTGRTRAAAVRVDGSTALYGSHTVSWLTALGFGVSVSAPLTVRAGTASPADAAAGFYDAFYAGRLAAACGYAVPGPRAQCAAALARARATAGTLRNAAIGFVVAKDTEALVTMTGLACGGRAAPSGCLGQEDPAWIFGDSPSFDTLWAGIAREGGNPLTATPLRQVAGHWYVDLTPSAVAG